MPLRPRSSRKRRRRLPQELQILRIAARAVHEDQRKLRRAQRDGADVVRSVTGDGLDAEIALEAAVGFEVVAKGLTGPGDVGLARDALGVEVLDFDALGDAAYDAERYGEVVGTYTNSSATVSKRNPLLDENATYQTDRRCS